MGTSLLALITGKYEGSIKPLLWSEREGKEVEDMDKNLLKLGHEATTKHLILTVSN